MSMNAHYRNRIHVITLALILTALLSQNVFAQTARGATVGGLLSQQLLQQYADTEKRINTLHAKAAVIINGRQDDCRYHECVIDLQQKKFWWLQSDSPELNFDRSTRRYMESIVYATSRLSSSFSQREEELTLDYHDDRDTIEWDIALSQTPFGAPLHFYELLQVPKPANTFVASRPLNMKEEDEVKYVILSMEHERCLFEVWLDPQHDYAVKKFSFNAEKGNDFAHGIGTYLYEVHEYGPKEEFYFPRKILIERSEHEREALIRIPGGESEKSILRGRTVKSEIRFYDVETNPKLVESSFRLKKEPPNYTTVVALNKFQIEHVWLDGKVVPYTDELALARVRGHGFKPSVREPRFWMMGAGIIMIVIALVLKVREYHAKRKGG